MHEVIGSRPAVIFFGDILNFWYIPSILGHVLGISVLYPWIYVLDNVYTWLNMVHTCIHLVYTFNILYIIVYTCNIQGHTMYIHVYTMYMSLCLEYKISWQEQSELFFNSLAIDRPFGHMSWVVKTLTCQKHCYRTTIAILVQGDSYITN